MSSFFSQKKKKKIPKYPRFVTGQFSKLMTYGGYNSIYKYNTNISYRGDDLLPHNINK